MKLKLVFSKLYNQMTHLPEKHMSKVSENIKRTLYYSDLEATVACKETRHLGILLCKITIF